MKKLIIRFVSETPPFFKRVARVAMAGTSLFGGMLALDFKQFTPLPDWAHTICVTGGAVCTAVIFICHLVTPDDEIKINNG